MSTSVEAQESGRNDDNKHLGDRSSGTASPSFGEQVLRGAGEKLASQLAESLFSGQPIGPALFNAMNPGSLISNMGAATLQNLGGMLMGSMLGSLFGKVNDSSTLGEQLAAKFAPQLLSQVQGKAMELANSALTGAPLGGDTMKDIQKFFFGVESAASISLGLSMTPTEKADYVLSPKSGKKPHHAVLREGDLALHHKCGVPSPFVKGHSTVIVNGKPTIGKGYTAICAKCGEPVMPEDLSPTVFMGEPPAPPAPPPKAQNKASKQIGDECTPGADSEALAESEEGGLGRPLQCEPNITKMDPNAPGGGMVARADGWNPPDWARDLFGITNEATADQKATGIDNWSFLWGAIELGSPQQPGAGTASSWWVPDKLFGYDMSPYFLRHDNVYDDDRNLSELPDIFGAEADAFTAGLANRSDPGLLILQMIYSGVTTTAGSYAGVSNTVQGRPSTKS